MAGLGRVAGLFADGYAAWLWLTTLWPPLDGAEPLALLARGEDALACDFGFVCTTRANRKSPPWHQIA